MDFFDWVLMKNELCGSCRYFVEYGIDLDKAYFPTDKGFCILNKKLKFHPRRKKGAPKCRHWKPERKE